MPFLRLRWMHIQAELYNCVGASSLVLNSKSKGLETWLANHIPSKTEQ